MKTAVIYSTSLRRLENSGVSLPDEIKKKFSEAGIYVENFILEGEKIRTRCVDFLNSNFDIIVGAGGDGTINSIASAVIGKEMPIGILPLGTFNHFAKDIEIPLNLDEAIGVILKKKIKKVDAGQVNDHFFINNSSIGMYPRMVRHRKSYQERLGGNKWLAMGTAFSKVITQVPNLKVEIKSEEAAESFETPIVFVGNNIYQMDLFNLGKRERIDEGKLGIFYINARGRFSILKTVFLALINRLHQSKAFKLIITEKLKIESRKSHINISLDGEVRKLQLPLVYKILPKSLNVIVP
jgi:diacylglycerol kinase family enzyme